MLKAGDAFEMTVPEVGTLKNVAKTKSSFVTGSEMPGEFAGKVIVITGAAAASAARCAVDFRAGRGADRDRVVGRRESRVGDQDHRGGRRAGAARDQHSDLRKLEGCHAAFNTGEREVQPLRLLVNSAGATKAGNLSICPTKPDGRLMRSAVRLRPDVRLFWPMLKSANGFVIISAAARSALARRELLDRRFGQCRDGAFLQGAVAASGRRMASTHVIIPARPRPDALSAHRAAQRRRPAVVEQLKQEATAKTACAGFGKADDHLRAELTLSCAPRRRTSGTAIAGRWRSTVGYIERHRQRAACVIGWPIKLRARR